MKLLKLNQVDIDNPVFNIENDEITILDMENVKFNITSYFAVKCLKNREKIVLCNVNEIIKEQLNLLNITHMLNIKETTQEAINEAKKLCRKTEEIISKTNSMISRSIKYFEEFNKNK